LVDTKGGLLCARRIGQSRPTFRCLVHSRESSCQAIFFYFSFNGLFQLPLLEALIGDFAWPVRHSAVFALPALLARLPRDVRHTLALQAVLSLTIDPMPQVRSGMLEALGEMICAFRCDGVDNRDDGPPKELLEAFLGSEREDRDQCEAELDAFYADPSRPLVCAFNFPAVVFTLGRNRWEGEVRLAYLALAKSEESRVRRSIAAGIGAIARILGQAWAERDLVEVWAGSMGFEEEGVRLRAVQCLGALMDELGEEKRGEVVKRLREVWEKGILDGWKEREDIAMALTDLARFGQGHDWEEDVRWLVRKALEDPIAAVRQAVVDNVSVVLSPVCSANPG
jgi:serine/threonine-protein phosphatase 4 regulatory subunit 1